MNNAADFRPIADLHRSGRLTEAEQALRGWLANHPEHAEAHYRLGTILHQTGRPGEALAALTNAMRLEPGQAAYPYLLGTVLHDLGRLDEAVAYFRQAISLRADLFQAHNNLGLVLRDQDKLGESIACFEAALRLKPDYAVAANNLGTVLKDAGQDLAAVDAFQRAVRSRPDYPDAWENLGIALMRVDRLQEAAQALQEALRQNPARAETHHNLARCLEPLGQMDGAIDALRQALRIQPDLVAARAGLARLLAMINHTDEAIAEYGRIARLQPDHLGAAIGAALTLPVIYDSVAAIGTARERYGHGLAELHAHLHDFLTQPPAVLLKHLHRVNFFLAYQGMNDRDPQASYGEFMARLLEHCLPGLMQPIEALATPRARVRVGFASSFFSHCTVGMYFRHWITRLDRTRFEVLVYQLSARHDQVGHEIEAHCDRYIRLNGPAAGDIGDIAARIKADELDILVYPELGMSAQTFLLAALRLAPVQCAGWGHPVTSGHGNIDVFLSCAAMEPADAPSHYTERLHLLQGIGTYYAQPQPPSPKRRADFHLPEDRTLYLFPQSLFKIHPDNDTLLARVLAEDARGTIVFFEGRHPDITNAFLRRLHSAFAEHGLDSTDRLVMLPYMQHDDYLRVNQLCDIMLDCQHWSGGNTSFDALSSGLPVVTLPGVFMRGRQSAGMLKLAGVEELIAVNADEYVRIATRLGRDLAWRAAIRDKLGAGVDRLFEREEPITALEQFLEGCATAGRKP